MNSVFYFVGAPSLHSVRTVEIALDAGSRRAVPPRTGARYQVESSLPRLMARLRAKGADALVIDARGETGDLPESPSIRLLEVLFGKDQIDGPIGREQTWMVVDGDPRGTRLA